MTNPHPRFLIILLATTLELLNESYWFCLQVVTDSGALALEDVFELISEGENLPVIAEEELQVSKI